MDINTQLSSLYELQQVDSALDALKRHYGALDRGQAEQATYDVSKAAHREAHAALKAAQAAVRDAELEQKTLEAKKTEEEARLYGGKVRAPKELQAIQEEVAGLDRQRTKLDEKILALMDDLETLRRQDVQARQTYTAATGALQSKVNAFNVDAETLKAQAQALAAQRKQAATAVPADLLKRYESLRATKGGLAIVTIEDGNSCGGCRMGLPSSTVGRARGGNAIVLCDNCERMLYWKA